MFKKLLLIAALLSVAGAASAQFNQFSYQKTATEKNPADLTTNLVDYVTSQTAATVLAAPCSASGPPTWRILCAETLVALSGTLATVTPAGADTVFLIQGGALKMTTVTDLTGGGGGAPTTAQYVVAALDAGLSAERVGTSSTSITWDYGTASQAIVKRAALTGDVTASADSNATTIAAAAVTLGKMADVATNTIFCRDTAGTGVPEICTLGASLDFTSANVLGRAALTGDVTASANSNATTIAAAAVTLAKMADLATNRLVGRATAGTGVPEALTIGTTLGTSGTTVDRAALTGDVTASAASNATTIKTDLLNSQTTKTTPTTADYVWIADAAASNVNKKALISTLPGYVQTVRLTGNITTNTSTLGNATGLSIAMLSGVTYNVKCGILSSNTDATIGLKLGATWGTMTAGAAQANIGVNASTVNDGLLFASGDSRTGTDQPGANTVSYSELKGTFVPSANGTFQVQYANETGTTVLTMYAGSNCIWEVIP